ncbi:MAG: glycerol kinase GlpK [Parasporobacterium sp.]|nr:glycerol kinase GlpK [Parasporobacterium sp.]
MSGRYIISIDQSTQASKALLFDKSGTLICRAQKPHKQIVDEKGYVSHNPEEIYENVIWVAREVLRQSNVGPEQVRGIAICNQRETSLIWDKESGKALNNAVVWHCSRGEKICEREKIKENADYIFKTTGIKLSAYFPAAKIAWLLENTKDAKEMAKKGKVCMGTMDCYLIYRLTHAKSYLTDYSNAGRSQLFDIRKLSWDEKICDLFGIDINALPKVLDSNACFGYTDFEGLFSEEVPICSVMGDSNAALFGQRCLEEGQAKATYGTGSSIMMNIGERAVYSKHGLTTSPAWAIDGKLNYVLEGNLNYTGAVISWLKNDLELIKDPSETESLANAANKDDSLYLIPAFTGLGAPYWNPKAKASITGMDRTTKKAEIVRAALECIAYQINDIIRAMNKDSDIALSRLKVDGGPTKNAYLMQFQADISNCLVLASNEEALSGIGVAYMAGMAVGLWDEKVFEKQKYTSYSAKMDKETAQRKYSGWKAALALNAKE